MLNSTSVTDEAGSGVGGGTEVGMEEEKLSVKEEKRGNWEKLSKSGLNAVQKI